MRTIPLSSPNGNKPARNYTFNLISVDPASAPQLPTNSIKRGDETKVVPVVEVSGETINVPAFDTAEEVQSAAGEHFSAWLVATANREIERAVQTGMRSHASSVKIVPANPADIFADYSFDVASLFAPTARAGRVSQIKQVKQTAASVKAALAAGTLSQDEAIRLLLGAAGE